MSVSRKIQLNVQWAINPAVTPSLVNQVSFLAAGQNAEGTADGVYMYLGHATPPVINGDLSEDQIAAIEASPMISFPVGSFFLSERILRELASMSAQALELLRTEVEPEDVDG